VAEEKVSFPYHDNHLEISFKQPLFSADIGSENMAVYFLLGKTLLDTQQFENHLAFTLSILEFMKTRVSPPKTGNDVFAEIREKNLRLTLGQVISRLAKHVSNQEMLDELAAIKRERNKLVHHFWRVLDWPFQKPDELRQEFELAEHLRVRMIYGSYSLTEYVQAADKRIKVHFGAIDIETKKIIMEDGSEAKRLK